MVGMWMLVKVVWKTLARVLRHFGWGGLLPLVAAIGMALFGVQPWTLALVVFALIVAAWWPAIAADLVPATMLVAGIWVLMVAAVAPGAGAGVSWAVAGRAVALRGAPQAFLKGPLPPKALHRPFPKALRPPALQGPASLPGQAVLSGVPAAKGPGFVLYEGKGQFVRENFVVPGRAAVTLTGPSGQVIRPAWAGPGPASAGPGGQVIKPVWAGPPPFPGGPPQAAVHSGVPVPTGLLVPLALLLLALGLWLTPRTMARLRARMPWLVPYLRRWALENRWGVLLVPVAAFGLVVFGVRPWTVAAVIAAVVAAVRWPKIAADLVPVTLVGIAAYGFAIASGWQSLATGPHGDAVRYGAVQVSSPQMALLAGAEASVLLAFAAWLTPRTIGAHARTLLHPGPDPELAGRLQRLTETRGHAIDAATSELRRIERDLHDGAQARLVALGMNLRAVERMLPASPQAALALVAEARETSLRALNDLRDLVRGIYPPVLADRGLGHAVEALGLDTPLPVRVDIDLPGRLTAPVESACYFAVAEVLANAVRHSGAQHVDIRIQHAGGILRIDVCDDGVGGADPAKGTGLQGVEQRLGTFDGIMAVSSPPGGPTMIVMEVPCALSSPKIFSF
jgi:signal transduction histidine kinase